MLWNSPGSGSKNSRSSSTSSCQLPVDNGEPDPSQFYSDSGSGPMNRQLSQQYQDLQSTTGYDDYNAFVQAASLEPEVYQSQNEYTKDINRSTSGASNMTVRSDPNDVNRWTGLRRPNYQDVYPAADARTDSSESPDQMTSATHYLI